MKVIELIPTGSKNAVSRTQLLIQCVKYNIQFEDKNGNPLKDVDREMRNEISEARKEKPIVHTNGKGYYFPDPKSEEDMIELWAYIQREKKRANDIYQSVKVAESYYNKWKGLRGVPDEGQFCVVSE